MQLKNILTEENTENFLDDCHDFLKENKDMFLEDLYLVRGASNHGKIDKISFRTRNHIKGARVRFYYFEKLKNDNIPSRRELVPCYGGTSTQIDFGKREYFVFPVENNYKLVYTEEIEDFNRNKIWDDVKNPWRIFVRKASNLGRAIAKKRNQDNKKLKKLYRNVDSMRNQVDPLLRTNKPSKIIKGWKIFEKFFKEWKNELNLHERFPDVYKNMKKYEEKMKKFISSTKVKKKIEQGMLGSEVGLYAPSGFYYVDKGYFKNELLKKVKDL